MIDLSIIPECYVDTNLIETIVPTKMGYNHQKGCGTVTKLMQGKLKDKFAVGIVDKDKKELKYADEFEKIAETGDMQLFRHKDAKIHHFLIFITPAVEKWIINNANTAGISLEQFELSSDLKELTKMTKKMTSKNDPNFKRLFRTLKECNVRSIVILSEWITYLKEKSYNTDSAKMREIANR